MHAIKEARKYIERKPEHPNAHILARLVLSLEAENDFSVNQLYALDYERFKLALEILHEWRLDRYIGSKAKLFDAALQVKEQK